MTWRTEWQLDTTEGPLPLLSGSWTFDRGWSPMGSGSVTVPWAAWEATGLNPLARHRMVLRGEMSAHASPHTLAEAFADGSTLGSATWPDPEARPYGDPDAYGASVGWLVYLRSINADVEAGTATLELATFETVLTETVNAGDPWLPSGLFGGGFDAGDVLRQMLLYIGVHAPVVVSAGAFIPPEEMAAWEPGQTAWQWWDRVRLLGELGYYVEPATGIVTIESAGAFTGTVPTDLLSYSVEYGTASGESATYADALTVVWTWTVEGAEGPEERTQSDTAYATGLSGWRDSRRHLQVERIGPPVTGYAKRAVNRLVKFRIVHDVTVPLTPLRLASAPGLFEQNTTFDFGDTTTVALTIITS